MGRGGWWVVSGRGKGCKNLMGCIYLGNVLLLYVLIYNLKVSLNFHSTFLQLTVIKMFTVQ